MITKEKVINIFEDIAVLLILSGENPFKSRAYSNAARNLEKVEDDLGDLARQGKLFEIEGIGDAIGKKITELLSTGKLDYYEKLKASVPPGHLEMLKISGLGPKKIHALHKELGISTVGELEYACHENRLAELKGFGKKTQGNILAGIERLKRYSERRLYDDVVWNDANALISFLQNNKDIEEVSIAGSLRRGNETVKDIDLLASSRHPGQLAEAFAGYNQVVSVIAKGDTKVSVTLQSGINADLRIVTASEYPYALHHFTGSKEHNTAMRARAKDMGLKMNEYGLFRGERNIVCRSEKDIFAALGLQYIEPELRENMGEIQAAEKEQLPVLIERRDVHGLHIHTNFSDGEDSLENMIKAARDLGMSYIGISDHSISAYYAGGLKNEDIQKQHALIDKLNIKHAPFYIFKGIESDIGPDGRLDYDEEILASFDFVIAAVHSGFNMPEAEMTGRIKKALANPFTTMLAHPTGRLLLSREPYAVNIKDIIDAAAVYGKALELNANPHRLDLDWRNCIHAVKKGIKIAINPDAHSVGGLQHINLGVKIARKGWLTKDDCLNCLSLEEMKKYLDNKHP